MKDMLPVGSKVKLNDGRIFIIIGYLPSKPNDAVLYDYICCRNMYGIRHKKEDLILNRDYFYINHDDISEVLFMGYSDEQFDFFNYYANLVKKTLEESKKDNTNLTQEELNDIYSKLYNKVKKDKGGDKDEK